MYLRYAPIFNPIRVALLNKVIIWKLSYERDKLDIEAYIEAYEANKEFMERGRGKKKSKPYIASVANQKIRVTDHKHHMNGRKERMRRQEQCLRIIAKRVKNA